MRAAAPRTVGGRSVTGVVTAAVCRLPCRRAAGSRPCKLGQVCPALACWRAPPEGGFTWPSQSQMQRVWAALSH